LDLTRQVIESILSKHYLNPHVETILSREGGEISSVIEVNCSWPKADFILKIYPDQFHWKMEKEVFVYDLLSKDKSIPAPTIIFFDDSKTLLPQNYLLMNKIDGTVLSQISTELKANSLRDIYRQAGNILRLVHSMTFENFGYISNGITEPFPDNFSYMTHQFQKKLSEFLALGGSQTIHDAVRESLSKNGYLLKQCQGAALCHNDYYEGNFLVQQINDAWILTGIIDVENALAGDPLLDIAKTYYYAVHNNPDKEQGFLEGYGKLPEEWKLKLNLYKLYHALELWDWFASIGNSAPLANIEADLNHFSGVEIQW
jgi:hygromycin-B 7''-O-kinase